MYCAGVALAPGKYTVELKFEPQGYLTGKKIDGIANVLLGIIVLSLLYLVFDWYRKK